MTSYSKEMIHREMILDHVKNPRHKDVQNKDGYDSYYLKNPACGDEVCMFIQQNQDKVESVTYDVSGCSICCASTSMISEIIYQKTKEEIKDIVKNYELMLQDKEYQEEAIGDLVSLEGIKQLPSRIRCATLAVHSVKEILFGDCDDRRI